MDPRKIIKSIVNFNQDSLNILMANTERFVFIKQLIKCWNVVSMNNSKGSLMQCINIVVGMLTMRR